MDYYANINPLYLILGFPHHEVLLSTEQAEYYMTLIAGNYRTCLVYIQLMIKNIFYNTYNITHFLVINHTELKY